MTGARRTPPGRAGRLRLRHSLDVAERGADLLEQKLRILRSEHQRLLRTEEEAARAWRDLLSEADGWLLRGLLLGGEQALDSATAGIGSAEITVHWTTSMGVRHPAAVSTSIPSRPATAAAPANTALAHAEAAYGRAVRHAAEYAAAHAAVELVGAEVVGTRHRARALRRHWIPRLREALNRSDLALEQNEHEDNIRRRWAQTDADIHP
ncbi:V-type ATPase, D subunit [Streptomyces sp. TRM S81-3]|uniref:V-type ATPase, D subunit n=1 Tax=Streptomyces griseicoloratus TaxID=2752516 RepID=A0A926QT45_9ACTN|nr:V-type ATP synthase subunit D [Streptomyces griseicoloratus]MBD0422711.1 V-type ATPase, D subunit [Streptomyces griseicoloratus]